MAFKLVPKLTALKGIRQFRSYPAAFGALTSSSSVTVEHDRLNRRFTVSLGSGAGKQKAEVDAPHMGKAVSGGNGECAVLRYRFTGEKEVDLMSTIVPESFRGRGVAAVLSKAAMDFLVEESLKAHVSCWYIKKYIEENPQLGYKDLVIT